ncbi:MAG: MerR family transcriptional regulator [Bacteriovoracaceae bacterium]|nr:MerR family transcriptional regulator [Bacteriovoracaceae bacterium]
MEVSVNLPAKSLFRFGEVASIAGVKPYVLRFWETEFEQITPSLGHDGEKLYEKKDLETIIQIKNLLFEHKLTIPKARQLLGQKETQPTAVDPRVLEAVVSSEVEAEVERVISEIPEVKVVTVVEAAPVSIPEVVIAAPAEAPAKVEMNQDVYLSLKETQALIQEIKKQRNWLN